MPIDSRELTYQVDNEEFTGYLCTPDATTAVTPAVLLIHEWWGHNDYIRSRAEQLAADGCIAFAIDLYGTGQQAATPEAAETLMNQLLGSEGAVEKRFSAAFSTLLQQDNVDADNVSAMGYCMGGAVALGMARAGKPLKVVASFHGLLQTDTPLKKGRFGGKIMVFNGADDPMVGDEILATFTAELEAAEVPHEITSYPGVVHGFTNPAATARGEATGMPLRYDADADHDSYTRTLAAIKHN